MKKIPQAAIISLLILLLVSGTPARFLLSHKLGDSPETKHGEITLHEDELSRLMGLEECGDKDEGCHKRRMVAEAHLDYIYTQHNKP